MSPSGTLQRWYLMGNLHRRATTMSSMTDSRLSPMHGKVDCMLNGFVLGQSRYCLRSQFHAGLTLPVWNLLDL